MSEILPGIRAKRKDRGLTMDQLADRLGVTRQAVGAWEGGIALPSADKLPEIAAALRCSIDDLYTGQDPSPAGGLVRDDINSNAQEDKRP